MECDSPLFFTYEALPDEAILQILEFLPYRSLIPISALNWRWRGLAKEEMDARNRELECMDAFSKSYHHRTTRIFVSKASSLDSALKKIAKIRGLISVTTIGNPLLADTALILRLHYRYGFTFAYGEFVGWKSEICVWELIFAHPTLLGVDLRTLLRTQAKWTTFFDDTERATFARLIDDYPHLSPRCKEKYRQRIKRQEWNRQQHSAPDIKLWW